MGELTLLHTADLHGRLTTAAADRLRELRERHQALLLDSGDAITAPNVLLWPWQEPVLARMTARVVRPPNEGERCVVVGWPIGHDGRKLHAGTALYGEDGSVLAVSRQLWIEPRATTMPA